MTPFSTFGRRWVQVATEAAARTLAGAVGLTGNETVAGIKTFSSNPIVSGGGIQFPATQVPSSDVNCLDDYEEGSYTPTITFGGGSTGLTYAANGQVGRYVKVGKLVYVTGRIVLSAKGSSTGSAVVDGLPFTTANVFNGQNVNLIGYYSNLASISLAVTGLVNTNATTFSLYQGGAASVAALTHSNFTNTSDFIWGSSYVATA